MPTPRVLGLSRDDASLPCVPAGHSWRYGPQASAPGGGFARILTIADVTRTVTDFNRSVLWYDPTRRGMLSGDRGVGSRADLRQRWVDRYLVRRAGTGRQHRGDAGQSRSPSARRSVRTSWCSTWRPSPTGTPSSRWRGGSPATRFWRPPSTRSRPRRGLTVEVSVRSAVPAGCGTGTSAAVAVALLGGLAALRGEQRSRRDLAYAAHRLEVDVLGVQSGIQDQLSAAFGGINYLEIDPYPEATVYPLPIWEELGPRLTLVFLGRAHDSSAVHRQVIEDVGCRGSAFSTLARCGGRGRDAVLAQDLEAFGQAMIANTEAQASLHPELVGVDARA